MQLGNMTRSIGSAILSNRPLPSAGPYPTGGPYLFCVYHKDQYPKGNGKMQAPHRGNGSDFDPSVPYRMYHGAKIPGFPQHPHRGKCGILLMFRRFLFQQCRFFLKRIVSFVFFVACFYTTGFETITATIEGLIDHADSAGNGGRYGMGDLQWMTAGEGIVHSEMFPMLNTSKENPTRFFQIWLNLPAKSKMATPSFAMFWANEVPTFQTELAKATIWVGTNYLGIAQNNNVPPPESWASDPSNDVALVHITIQPGGKMTLPKAHEPTVNRSLFYIEGEEGMIVDGKPIGTKRSLLLDPTQDLDLELPESHKVAGEFLWMQGKPIDEPVSQYGPFVMNTPEEIQQAFADYRATQFGGWPWPRDDMVFPSDKGRFALFGGVESVPKEDDKDDDTCSKTS